MSPAVTIAQSKFPLKYFILQTKARARHCSSSPISPPPPVYCLPQGRFPRCSEHWEYTERKLLKLGKRKCPGNAEPVHNFLQKKKVPFPETEPYANSSGGTCVLQVCCFVKQKTPTKQKASPAAFFSTSKPSFRYIQE